MGAKRRPQVEKCIRNGVVVKITRSTEGSVVEASCGCLGYKNRTHTSQHCPNIPRKRCKGRLCLEHLAGMLVRQEDGMLHGYCPDCDQPISLRDARRVCNRVPQ